jgi:hypothetical protein
MYYDGMLQRVVGTVLAVLIISCGLGVQSAAAVSENIVISSVQLGTTVAAAHEFIELYNNSSSDVDITDWCAYYASATSITNGSKLGCFVVDNSSLHLFLPAGSQAFLISSALKAASPTLGSDLLFSATLSGTAGHIRVIDSAGLEIDKLGWGLAAVSAETSPAAMAPNGQIIMRNSVAENPGLLRDSDNNAMDFTIGSAPATHAYGSIYELQDICNNIDGIQQTVPDAYASDDTGMCLPPPIDLCVNIDDMQAILPDGFMLNEAGECIDVDVCHNLADTQLAVPDYYAADDTRYCTLVLPSLLINEVMANPDGGDEGSEFIEVYNPNDFAVAMDLYILIVGAATPKAYQFPTATVISAGAYLSFSDDDINFTLVNSTSRVSLVGSDGRVISSSDYVDPAAGFSWSLIDGDWMYTNIPTAAMSNQKSAVDPDVEEEVVGEKPCAPNQYRHPETQRCRVLVAAGSVLTPCKDNQYRSEETNRCRTVASSTSILAPCSVNQERNPDTNRCRTIVTTVPDVPFAVEPIVETGQAAIGWWALGGIGILALAYAGWEWRVEIIRASRHLAGFFVRAK